MKAEKIHKEMLNTLGIWQYALEKYSEDELKKKTSDESWTMGQVYSHIIDGTLKFHLAQVEKCLEGNENMEKGKSMPGKIVFLINSFPPIKIKVPPSDEYTPKQPENKEAVLKNLNILQDKLKELSQKIDSSNAKGKTKHPGFAYLSAIEWYKLIGLHFKHHLRQKSRIDVLLKS